MPAARTTPKDVLIRVPKVEPYSNSYLPPSVRAKEEAKKLAAAAAATTTTTSAEGTGQVGTSAAAGGATTSASTSAPSTAAPLDAAAALATPSAAAPPLASTDTAGAASTSTDQPSTAAAEGEKEKDRSERGNSPTLPFLSVEREEDQTVQLSKAATSSAAWNSLLVWARRQRGAQWDASTALWQVGKYSKEYYTFCEDPATKDRSKQPGDPKEGEEAKETLTAIAAATATAAAKAAGQEDLDKGPTKVSSRNKGEDAGAAGGSPPVAPLGRTVRLVRRP
ncbi:uncharacterized protein UBRO_03068 [Ustilago bromivora]|uniref:Uncharacterized protein n=1 Tax=Ustilago bromivora TaxID=307758 RepID=A0A1K0H633_9BASI|nr:uncharacterized protein UBRO_03068 [Ustilago bromivora]SYW83479.1 uncharacterized protein UBRO2_05181 [Ustilago bromivora]